MFEIHRKELMWGGRKLVLETGHIARQSDGAVMVSYEDTSVLCAAVAAREARAGIDFFPLTVHYVEKTYAAGKIPGGFFKREGRPSEKETLTSRLIDRPIRPLFVDGFRNETQIICTTTSHDLENDPDVPALIGASAALTISGIPFMGPIAAARVGYINGKYVLNPRLDELEASDLDMVVAGTAAAVMMVESEAEQLPEDVMMGAVIFAHEEMQAFLAGNPDIENASDAQIEDVFKRDFGEKWQEMLSYCRNRQPGATPMEILSSGLNEANFAGQTSDFAADLSDKGIDTWLYRIDWSAPESAYRACHCIELPFVFNTFDRWMPPMIAGLQSNEATALSRVIQKTWGSFAANGDPNHEDLIEWPAYNADRRSMIIWNKYIETVNRY